MPADPPDLIILGGGLAGGLAALALRRERPGVRLTIVEPGERIGGNHLWSFFDSDVAPVDQDLIEPLISHRWAGYEVRFPAHRRRIGQAYRTIESERLDTEVRAAVDPSDIIRASAVAATPDRVTLDDGRVFEARAVLDTRGLFGPLPGLACGWQKFCGQLLDIDGGHGLTEPIVMDAAVDQTGGYRFVYCLPFSATQLFVEDTYYSEKPDLDRAALTLNIAEYAKTHGWRVAAISREETGVLPVVTGGDFGAFWPAADPVARAGVRAALFHPLTSYSLPDAVRFASWLARDTPLDISLAAATRKLAKEHWRRGRFDRLLSRMLFHAADPPDRYRILERFYRLPAPLIARFYAGRSTLADRLRILAGKPPVAVGRAIGALMEGL
ncbi:MAG: lycopene beta-cyclase CrtY [Sphingomonas sp.]|nr:lycopene beta-cyclase CrtY [Sphingomonas sp.]